MCPSCLSNGDSCAEGEGKGEDQEDQEDPRSRSVPKAALMTLLIADLAHHAHQLSAHSRSHAILQITPVWQPSLIR